MRTLRLLLCCLGLLSAAACGGIPTKTDADEKIADRLVGRWFGEPVDPPARTWFREGNWDVWFSPSGDFTSVVSYPGDAGYKLHLEGRFRVYFGALYIDEPSLAGAWTVVERDKDHVVIQQGDVAIALRRRFGT
jgi:hypothetical protein